jgi:MFS superfamily sulfate permease-like transporter
MQKTSDQDDNFLSLKDEIEPQDPENIKVSKDQDPIQEKLLFEEKQLENIKSRSWFERKKESWTPKLKRSFVKQNLFPLMFEFHNYTMKSFLFDLISGLTLCFVFLAHGVAYSVTLRIDYAVGILSGIYLCFLYPLFGSLNTLVLSPESSSTVVLLSLVESIDRLDGSELPNVSPQSLIVITSFIAGFFYFYIFLTRKGYLCHIISGPLLYGLSTAIALYIMITVLNYFLSLKSDSSSLDRSFIKRLEEVGSHQGEINIATVIFSVVVLLLLVIHRILRYVFPKNSIVRHFPITLIVIVGSTLCSYFLDLKDNYGIETIGKLQTRFYSPGLPYVPMQYWVRMIISALVLMIIGFTETSITAKECSEMKNVHMQPNRNALVLSIINIIIPILGGMHVIGSDTGSSVVMDMQPNSMLHFFIGGIFLIILYAGFPITISYIPNATIAAILFMAAFNLIKFKQIYRIFQRRDLEEISLMLISFLVTILTDVEVGVYFALLISLIHLARYSTNPTINMLGKDPKTDKIIRVRDNDGFMLIPGITIIQINSPLY